MPRHLLVEIEHLFETYKTLEQKHVTSFGWETAETARRGLVKASEAYRNSPRAPVL
ncbi:MAG: hypothetical protein COS95_09985 [Ignavibacteriales bacterium CG07_land_8_20_14_0_80_59_12]|nr:MAG: hypothetical protein COS95_09985 [Ignavibacteriales bacterium CG07_land_8_20_14_0_80_59_12]